MKSSFCEPESAIKLCMEGYAPNFYQIRYGKADGYLIFNQDSTDGTKVNIYALQFTHFEQVIDKCLELIWSKMECTAIRIYLHHYKQDDKIKVNEDLKKILKERKFKWLSLKNEATQRIEVLECKGLQKGASVKDPVCLTLNMQSSQAKPDSEAYSIPLLMHSSFPAITDASAITDERICELFKDEAKRQVILSSMSLPFTQSLRFGAVHSSTIRGKPFLRISNTEIQRLTPPASSSFSKIYLLPAAQQTLLLLLGSNSNDLQTRVQ